MKLAPYALTWATVVAGGTTLLVYGAKPLPVGWLDSIVAPRSTIGHAVVIVSFWTAGVGSILLSSVLMVGPVRDAWRFRKELRRASPPRADC